MPASPRQCDAASRPITARNESECEVYARPINLLHALFLTLGVLAIARAAELIRSGDITLLPVQAVWRALALATEANLFSFVMTEAIVFSLYSVTALAMLKSWITNEARWQYAALSGLLLGILVLARTAYVVLAPVLLVLLFFAARPMAGTAAALPGLPAPMLASHRVLRDRGRSMGRCAIRSRSASSR